MEMEVSALKPLSEKRTRTAKYLVPLFFDKIEEPGFINAYTCDINRPWMEDKILLVYDYKIEKSRLESVFKQHEYYFDMYFIRIDEMSYTVYVFNIPHTAIFTLRNIQNGLMSTLDVEDKRKIIQFWPNENHLELIEGNKYISEIDSIPIEDIMTDPMEFLLGIA